MPVSTLLPAWSGTLVTFEVPLVDGSRSVQPYTVVENRSHGKNNFDAKRVNF